MTDKQPYKRGLTASERFDYERLKQLELQGIEQYAAMRKAPTLSEDAVLSFINQLSQWNLKTTGADILRAYLQGEVERAEQRGVAWAVGVLDKLHIEAPGHSNQHADIDKFYKGAKNTLRDRFKAETGIDPAPSYPVKVQLAHPKTTKQEQQS